MKKILQKIVEDRELEARWLNTLSLLEYIGSSKISKTVCLAHPSLEILEHFSDEARHAHAFKRLSHELSKRKCHDYLCADEAISYFQMLDHTISEWLTNLTGHDDFYQNYLFVTDMIERRAMKVYPLYKSVTQSEVVREELQDIILEETRHMHDIEKKALKILKKKGLRDFSSLFEIEEHFYQVFEASLRKKLFSPEMDHAHVA